MTTQRLPRVLHPGAWWLWAIGVAAAATSTTNPLVLALLVGVSAAVVAARRTEAPWARGFHLYIRLALIVIAIRVVFRVVLGGQDGTTILFRLPELHLPEAAAGIRIGGPVSLNALLAAVYDGVRLAALLICLGAANVLADAKRLLKLMPGALYEIGVAVTVALTVAPQIVESAQRINRARRLRAEDRTGRFRGLVRRVFVPVLEDALDRSLVLASAMDSRGYGRRATGTPSRRRLARVVMLVAPIALCVGVYGLLDSDTPAVLGTPTLVVGCGLSVWGVRLSGRGVLRTVYRPDPWRWEEWAVVACGLAAPLLMILARRLDADSLYPTVQPLRWPRLSLVPALAAVAALAPAWIAPPVQWRRGPTGSVDRSTPPVAVAGPTARDATP